MTPNENAILFEELSKRLGNKRAKDYLKLAQAHYQSHKIRYGFAGLGGLGATYASWKEWYEAMRKGQVTGTPGAGQTTMRVETQAMTDWRRARAAERAAGIRGPAMSAKSVRSFQQAQAWSQAMAARKRAILRKRQEQQEAARKRRAEQAEKSRQAQERRRQAAREKAKAQKEMYKQWAAASKPPKQAAPGQARYKTPWGQQPWAQATGGDYLKQLQQRNIAYRQAAVRGRGPVGAPGTAVAVGWNGLSGLG